MRNRNQRLRLLLILKPQTLGIIRTPHKYPVQLPLTFKPTTRREKPATRRQPPAPVANKTRQHLPTFVILTLSLKIVQELPHRRPLVVCVELKVHVVDHVPVLLPQSHVVALHLVVVERRNGGEGNDVVVL